ncbi:MAG: MmgE/PrpD family protein, partial [Candidatus Eremiobacteraeota bacterium]|nr:MmgE/PrpD family protein [Candidatus Eremiobacteraeota bacterium]
VVAAALAAGEIVHADDERVADAIAVGREVAARLATALTLDAAWDVETVTAGIAATMAAAHAAGLDAAQAENALGLAATQAAGLGVLAGVPAEDFLRAKSAADAVEAAFLARHGFTAAPRALEGGQGLARLLASRLDQDALTAELGVRWISAP